MTLPIPLPTRIKGPAKITIVLSVVLLIMALSGGMAQAHGAIVPDGNPADWCSFAALTGVPDVRATLTPPGCAAGNEVLWEDSLGDSWSAFGPFGYDIQYFATTADATNVSFVVGFVQPPAIPPVHLQIAIDVAPGPAVNANWYNPLGAFLLGVGATIPNGPFHPDYMIVTNVTMGTATLWESTTVPGGWTPIGAPFPYGIGVGVAEFQLPWAAFACPGCPAFGVNTTANLTVLSTSDAAGCMGAPGTPCVTDFENDIFSEVVPGIFTTTATACASGPTSLGCELGDGSADAFITVTYQNPTAVELTEMNTQSQSSSLAPILGVLLLGSSLAWLVLRRKRAREQV